jgi:hypothetical protein
MRPVRAWRSCPKAYESGPPDGREVRDHYVGAALNENGGEAARASSDLQDALFRLQIAAQKAEMDLEGHPTGDVFGEPVLLSFAERVVVAADGIDGVVTARRRARRVGHRPPSVSSGTAASLVRL